MSTPNIETEEATASPYAPVSAYRGHVASGYSLTFAVEDGQHWAEYDEADIAANGGAIDIARGLILADALS